MVELRKFENPFVVNVSREFEASAQRVFDVWVDPANVGNWLFGTPDGKNKISEVDPWVGGNFIIGEQRGDEFAKHVGTYHEINRPSRLVFSYYYESEEEHLPSNVTVEISQTAKGCVVSVTHEMDNIYAEYEASATEGWNMIFDGLSKYINRS